MQPTIQVPARVRGFTLIELMIVVAIVGLLATIAYPSFMGQVRKSRRADAVQALAALQQAQERWRAAHASYAGNTDLAVAWPNGLGQTTPTAGGYYNLSIATSPAPTGLAYVASASAAGGQAADSVGATSCATLSVTVASGNATYTPAACWSQ